MVISWLTVLESHRKAIRPNLAKGSGWRMTPGDNQLAHLVKKTCSQCSIIGNVLFRVYPVGSGERLRPSYIYSLI